MHDSTRRSATPPKPPPPPLPLARESGRSAAAAVSAVVRAAAEVLREAEAREASDVPGEVRQGWARREDARQAVDRMRREEREVLERRRVDEQQRAGGGTEMAAAWAGDQARHAAEAAGGDLMDIFTVAARM